MQTPPPTFSKSLLQQPFAELKKAVNAMRREAALETSAANQKKMQATIDLLVSSPSVGLGASACPRSPLRVPDKLP